MIDKSVQAEIVSNEVLSAGEAAKYAGQMIDVLRQLRRAGTEEISKEAPERS